MPISYLYLLINILLHSTPDRLIDVLPMLQSDASMDPSLLPDSLPRTLSESDSQRSDSLVRDNPLTLSTEYEASVEVTGTIRDVETGGEDRDGGGVKDTTVSSGSKKEQIQSCDDKTEGEKSEVFTSPTTNNASPNADSTILVANGVGHVSVTDLLTSSNTASDALIPDISSTLHTSSARADSSPDSSLPPSNNEQVAAVETVITSPSPVPTEESKTAPPPQRDRPKDIAAASKHSSNASSRAQSGKNTPNPKRGSSPSNTSSSKGGSVNHSPLPSRSPLLSSYTEKSANSDSPSYFPGNIKAKLESLVSPSEFLPSPLYGREEKSLKKRDSSDVDGEEVLNPTSIYKAASNAPLPVLSDKDAIIEAAVMLSNPNSTDSHVSTRRNRVIPPSFKPEPRKIISKPGLECNNLRLFFKNVIADESSEILMNVTWGISNLSSAPSCEVEVGTIISDRGVYLLEVLDPENHKARPLSWSTENFPLAKITCCYHYTLRKIYVGIFDQSLTVESFEKGVVKRFVFFPHSYQKLNMFVENLKAAFDASQLPYIICSSEDKFMNTDVNGMCIKYPGSTDMADLKDGLIWSSCRAQVGNFIAVNSKSETNPLTISFNSELKRVSNDNTSKFEIVQYVIVGEISSDILPISNGKLHVLSRTLILTNKTIYLCKEELDSWPHETTSIRSPPFPRCVVIDSHPISRISGIRMCDKSHPIVSYTDPLYEFSISFEELDDIQLSPTLSTEWLLCVHDRQYLDQLLGCLTHLSNDNQKENHVLISIKHVTNRLMTIAPPKPPKVSLADSSVYVKKEMGSKNSSNRGINACFISSKVLFEFSVLTNYQRLKFFKRHIAQAEFLKSDEVPLSVFLCHCSYTAASDYVEIEACIITSNYGIYLLSDLDNINRWVEGGGLTSFPRRDLLDKKNSGQIRCLYRLWLNEIKLVDVGVFYSSVEITDTKEPECSSFTIHTENTSATLSLLSALSCMVDLHDKAEEKEMDSILSDYEFVVEPEQKKPESNKQHYVEFSYHSEDTLEKLKREMMEISPAVKKGKSVKVLQILHQQVMLLVEELKIRDMLTSRFHPHLVFLTNYGIYVCFNVRSEKRSPSILDPNKLSVKKWCHIDLVERLHVYSSRYSCYNIVIYLRTTSRGSFSSEDTNTLSLLAQNSELLNCFLHHFSLMYHERCGKQISITRD